jgi:hypothetical protein
LQVNIRILRADLQISRKGHCNSFAIADDFVMAMQILRNLASFEQQDAIKVLQIKRVVQAHDDGLATEFGSFADRSVETCPRLNVAVCHRLIKDADKNLRVQETVERARKRQSLHLSSRESGDAESKGDSYRAYSHEHPLRSAFRYCIVQLLYSAVHASGVRQEENVNPTTTNWS